MEVAIAYQDERPALSLVDSFALALASHQGWPLLTEDRAMRSVADSKGIAHLDALWIIDNLLDTGILSASSRSWLLLKQCVTIQDVRFPNPGWLFAYGDWVVEP